MKYFYFLLCLIFIYSCGDEALSPEEDAAQVFADDPRPKLLMTMSDDLELTISLQNFEETVSYMTLEIIYNPDALEVTSYSKGAFGDPSFANMDVMDVNNNDSAYCSFIFSSDISGSGDLLNLKFNGSASSYQGSTIYIASILLEDASWETIELSDGLYLQDICYISTHPTNGDILFNGDYKWSNSFCWPLNYAP